MAELKLTAVKKDSRTVLSSLYFTTPNKIAKPFYDVEKTKGLYRLWKRNEPNKKYKKNFA